jgi:hypothetical protein
VVQNAPLLLGDQRSVMKHCLVEVDNLMGIESIKLPLSLIAHARKDNV